MIALPIVRFALGDAVIPAMSTVGTLMQAGAVLVILNEAWGRRATVITLAVVAVLTFGVEWLGSQTGFPFGSYHYTDLLQIQLFDVPLLIPLAWLMMLAPSWAVAQQISARFGDGWRARLAFIGISALAMTAWDLYLDPQMVGWGFWVWDQPGAYFGIPLVNYAGWLATSGLVTALVRPARVPARPLLIIYGVVWAFQAIGLAVFWGQPGPALFGFVGMGTLFMLALRSQSDV
jgi:putative membrane protein